MKKFPIIFSICILVLVIILVVFFNQKTFFEVSTFKKLQVYRFEEKIEFEKTITIKASNDDFIEEVFAEKGDFVQKDSILLKLENAEEEFNLTKARNEYAMAVLNSGSAIQEEKKKAIALAEKKLLNTNLHTPVDAYVLETGARKNMFTEKGATLFVLVESDSNLYVRYDSSDKELLDMAEYVSLEIKPEKIKLMLDTKDIDGDMILKIPIKLDEINGENLDILYGIVEVKYHSEDLAWIPVDYLSGSTVELKSGTLINVEILEKKEDLILVKGLNSGEILTTKR